MAMKHHDGDGRRPRTHESAHEPGRGASRSHDGHRHAALDPADGTEVAARLFHGLSDPGRLRILRHLELGEHRVVDLTSHLGLAQSTVSAHVACLRDCGLLDVRHEGRSSYYRLAHPDATHALLATGARLVGIATPEELD